MEMLYLHVKTLGKVQGICGEGQKGVPEPEKMLLKERASSMTQLQIVTSKLLDNNDIQLEPQEWGW